MNTSIIAADFSYTSHYLKVFGANMHYIDTGGEDSEDGADGADPLLFLHGNPTSSYLWRNIIPHLRPWGRCIALDLIGMGRSDKPAIEYRFFDHMRYVEEFIHLMGLQRLTLVVHDWGSMLGFTYAQHNEASIKGIAFMEALLAPVPGWDAFPKETAKMFQMLRTADLGRQLVESQNIFVEKVLPAGIVRTLSEQEMEHYREPFKDPASRKPTWRWPNEIPIAGEPADVAEVVSVYSHWLQSTQLPKLLIYATPGAMITAPQVQWCRANLQNLVVADAGSGIHTIQEDNPRRIGSILAQWYRML